MRAAWAAAPRLWGRMWRVSKEKPTPLEDTPTAETLGVRGAQGFSTIQWNGDFHICMLQDKID